MEQNKKITISGAVLSDAALEQLTIWQADDNDYMHGFLQMIDRVVYCVASPIELTDEERLKLVQNLLCLKEDLKSFMA